MYINKFKLHSIYISIRKYQNVRLIFKNVCIHLDDYCISLFNNLIWLIFHPGLLRAKVRLKAGDR